jgi:hypothetical protein
MLPEFAVTAGDHTKAIFAAIGIGMMSDSDLLESRLVAASGLRIEQQYAARDGRRFAIPAATVSREPGLGLGTRIDPDDVPLVLSLRPDRALADVVSDGEMGSGADAQKLVKIVRTFRELIALGMVLVPEMSSESR